MSAENPGRTDAWRPGVIAWTVFVLLPMAVACVVLAVEAGMTWRMRALTFVLGMLGTAGTGFFAGHRLLATLGSAFDLLLALREGDYGLRVRVRSGCDPLQPLLADINALSDELRALRRKRSEASRFFGKSLAALRDPVFVIDDENRLILINRAGRRLIGAGHTTVTGQDIASLGLSEPLSAPDETILSWHFAAASGRWAVRRAAWYSEGRENTFLMLHDLSAALGEEERYAWQRLIRVLSHELNNSLTPIGSLASSLRDMLDGQAPVAHDELRQGLEVISRRSASLGRFLGGYGRLARLPPPRLLPFRLDLALERLARLEKRSYVQVSGGEPLNVVGDEDQLEQAFVNLLRNAVEAALPGGGGVRVGWRVEGGRVRVEIENEGPPLPDSGALFVPFFTTKPDGSGIGLSLTRLIIEAHAGTVDLDNRPDATGVVATVRLPLAM